MFHAASLGGREPGDPNSNGKVHRALHIPFEALGVLRLLAGTSSAASSLFGLLS